MAAIRNGRHLEFGSAIALSKGRPTKASAGRHTTARSAAALAAPKTARTSKVTAGAHAKTSSPRSSKEDLRAQIDALSVLARPDLPADASDGERAAFEAKKAAALDTLAAYFDPLRAAETASAMRQTASAMRETLRALTARVAKAEKASARATLARVQAAAAAMRHEAQYGPCAAIERAGRNTLRAIPGHDSRPRR
jgi:hypothetical protein